LLPRVRSSEESRVANVVCNIVPSRVRYNTYIRGNLAYVCKATYLRGNLK
jgi:hypothetical protein